MITWQNETASYVTITAKIPDYRPVLRVLKYWSVIFEPKPASQMKSSATLRHIIIDEFRVYDRNNNENSHGYDDSPDSQSVVPSLNPSHNGRYANDCGDSGENIRGSTRLIDCRNNDAEN